MLSDSKLATHRKRPVFEACAFSDTMYGTYTHVFMSKNALYSSAFGNTLVNNDD